MTIDDARKLLQSLPNDAKIEITKQPGKVMILATTPKDKLVKQKFPSLIGQAITVTDAAEKYNLNRRTIIVWTQKGYIDVIKPGYQMELNEADLAYLADIYHERKNSGIGFGAPLLDDNGLPYQIKRPALSSYRKRRKN